MGKPVLKKSKSLKLKGGKFRKTISSKKHNGKVRKNSVSTVSNSENVKKMENDDLFVDDTEANQFDIDDSDIDNSDDELTSTAHKKNLEDLKKKDPEFYQYLQQHDKELLDFDDPDEDEDDDLAQDEEIEEEMKEEKITLKNVNDWRKVLQNPTAKLNCLAAIKSIIKAFRKTVNQTIESTDNVAPNSLSMLDSSVFNAIINTALFDLVPALIRFLRLQNLKSSKELLSSEKNEDENENVNQTTDRFFDPRRSRNWKRAVACVKVYLTDVLKLMDSLGSEARVTFERHVLELTPFFNAYPHLIKRLIKRSMKEWCSGEEQNRVVAFLILHRSIRVIHSNDHFTKQERLTIINQVLRKLYLTFVSVSKNTNETSIEQIGFMRNSLVELYGLDDELAYQHAFIFIRQLSINLRSSYILKQKVCFVFFPL